MNDALHAVMYTDGGSITDKFIYGGWGIHGYTFTDTEVNSNSGCKRGAPYKKGYAQSKSSEDNYKVPVVNYFDFYGAERTDTTNNRAELLAAIKACRLTTILGVKSLHLLIDSKYVLNVIHNRTNYKDNGYKSSKGKDLANKQEVIELIDCVDNLIESGINISYDWVEGHSGNLGNDKADLNATRAMYRIRNVINGVEIPEDDDIPAVFSSQDEHFRISTPDEYWKGAVVAPLMLCENSLFFANNGTDQFIDGFYYQASFGAKLTSLSKEDKRAVRGKPFADCCVSVVKLNEPEPIVGKLVKTVTSNITETGIYECDLSYLTRSSVYDDLTSVGLYSAFVDKNRNKIILPDKTEIVNLLNPVGQAYSLLNDFSLIRNFLTLVSEDEANLNNLTDNVIGITHYLYETTEKKGKTAIKSIDYPDGYFEVQMPINEYNKTTSIRLTIGVDLPNKGSLARLKGINPKVELFTWDVDSRTLRYGTIIRTDEGIGIWVGLYSNLHLH